MAAGPVKIMLPFKNRLKRKSDFERVFKKGFGFKEKTITLRAMENGLKTSRFGFVVSNKISKKAVARNKIKRRMREAAKRELSLVKTGFDVVFIAGPDCKNKSFFEIQSVMEKLYKRAGIITA